MRETRGESMRLVFLIAVAYAVLYYVIKIAVKNGILEAREAEREQVKKTETEDP